MRAPVAIAVCGQTGWRSSRAQAAASRRSFLLRSSRPLHALPLLLCLHRFQLSLRIPPPRSHCIATIEDRGGKSPTNGVVATERVPGTLSLNIVFPYALDPADFVITHPSPPYSPFPAFISSQRRNGTMKRLQDASCAICMDSLFDLRDDLDEVLPIATPDCGESVERL